MAACGSLRFCERFSGGHCQTPALGSFILLFGEPFGCTVRMRAVLKIGWFIPHLGRNLWLTCDAARLTAADGAEKRYKAKAGQITLGMRIASVLQNRTLLLDSP
jgi:hypothetical protein